MEQKNIFIRALTKSRHISGLLDSFLALALVIGIMTISSNSQAAVIAVDSYLQLQAKSNSNGAGLVIDTDSASQGGTINTLSASVNATSTSAGGQISTTGDITASWNNTAVGQVLFHNVGWDSLNNVQSGVADINRYFDSNINRWINSWAYTFTADVTGMFSLDYDVILQQGSTTDFGLGGFEFSLLGGAGGQTIMGVGSSGTTTRNIAAGQTYTRSMPYRFDQQQYSWALAVPEQQPGILLLVKPIRH